MEGGAPKGRRLDGDSGMKKSGEMRLKSTIYESTLSTADAAFQCLRGKAKRTGAERPITICGEAAATTLNPEPLNL